MEQSWEPLRSQSQTAPTFSFEVTVNCLSEPSTLTSTHQRFNGLEKSWAHATKFRPNHFSQRIGKKEKIFFRRNFDYSDDEPEAYHIIPRLSEQPSIMVMLLKLFSIVTLLSRAVVSDVSLVI